MDDTKIPEKSGYGVDVALRRADDLDRKMIGHVLKKDDSKVLDLGSGAGGQSVRLCLAGASVTAVDIDDYSDEFLKLREENNLFLDQLKFIQGDIRNLKEILKGEKFDDCCLQRTIHYLSYQEAEKFLKELRGMVSDRLYISVTGLGTAIGEKYPDRKKSVSERFAKLPDEEAEIFSVQAPVCLYTEKEFIELLQSSGWQILESSVSQFGNIKAVCF
ncbi:MAG: class I SAM-dependent methyltransferase [Candidatus Nomurabacteria bacterium]|nr:class I SAM-dependent methyltransferase [Candidatus Nomurabacteria bacterium]USN87692.1 MAG: class I SAM-dependent methyltransferase [Candidatus Nomurabacteria bacterium]